MTTIIFKDGKLFADTRISHYDDSGAFLHFSERSKFLMTKNRVITGAGSSFVIELFSNSFNLFFARKFGFTLCFLSKYVLQNSSISNVVVIENEIISVFNATCLKIFGIFSCVIFEEKVRRPISSEKWFSVGSGSDFAGKKINAGEEAYNAMIYSSKADVFTNNKIQVLDLYSGELYE